MTDRPTRTDLEPEKPTESGDTLSVDPTARTLKVDVEAYMHFLDGEDLTDAQKRELIETLWTVVCSFVDLGFGGSPLSGIVEKERADAPEKAPQNEMDRVDLNNPSNSTLQETPRAHPAEESEES
ncbi:MAG: hypothetical protein ROR55_28725 [Devosia sp.]